MTGATAASCSASGLQSAINSSTSGRVSLPAACSITLSTPITVNRDIVIDANGATISGSNVTRIFEIGRNNAMNRGFDFTLMNAALINGRDSGSGGGAIRGAQFGTITVLNSSFQDNVSLGTGGEDGGGALFKDEGGKLTLFNSTFRNNTATNGGAVKSLGANVQVVNSAFEGNVSRGGNNGGGAYFLDGLEVRTPKQPISGGGYAPDGYTVNSYGKGRFCGVLFRNNSVGGQHDFNLTGRQGGGLFTHTYSIGGQPIPGTPYFTAAGFTLIEVERSIFEGNTAADGGGALRLGGDGGNTAVPSEVSSSMFVGNRAGNHGGAIRMSLVDANYVNATLADNCANGDGSVLGCTSNSSSAGIGGGIVGFEKQYNVTRLTVVRNRAASYGGGLNQNGGSSVVGAMSNSIVAANAAGNPFNNITNTCAGPLFTNGSASYQWPAPTSAQFDAGCGAANSVNPAVSTTKTLCTTTAGSSTLNASHYVFAPGANVTAAAGVPVAGALCPVVAADNSTAPAAPTIGSAAAGDAMAMVSFSAPVSNGGSAILSYTATSAPGAITGACTAPCASINVLGLVNGQSYSFTVKAINAIGASPDSAPSNAVTPELARCNLDFDGDGEVLATTDGLILSRVLLGMTGNAVSAAAKPGSPRANWSDIRSYLNTRCGTRIP
ncbi:MAG: fibronectin type III domain-containing protein [Betaproteobacteria bacterium]|nr:MAG: fibronectin type III domain-containing protein [Betaproteobacteria bacterium]